MSVLVAERPERPALPLEFQYPIDDSGEQGGWKQAVVVASGPSWNRTQIKSWPSEFIEVVEDDPGTLSVESEVLLHPGRNLDGGRGIKRRRVRKWRDGCRDGAVTGFAREHDEARPGFDAFRASAISFTPPQIGVGNHEAALWLGEAHEALTRQSSRRLFR